MLQLLGSCNHYSLVPTVGLLIVLVFILPFSKRCRCCFANLVVRPIANPLFRLAFASARREILQSLNDMVSHDDFLNEADVIRVLEVGIGTGANFRYIGRKIRLVAVEPNPAVESQLMANLKKCPNIRLERFLSCFGEEMDAVKDESVDAVIITHVLCSVADVKQVLSEVKRVLAPGGRFIFLEHTAYPAHTREYKIQKLLEPLTYLLNCPCDLNRRSGDAILEAGLGEVFIKDNVIPVLSRFQRHISGVAVKASNASSNNTPATRNL